MRVLQLGPYPPPHGGVQSNLVAIHRLLLGGGFSPQVINTTRNRKPDANGVFYPKNWLGLLRFLMRLRYDIVHLHIGGNVTTRLLALAFACCSIPGKKAVLTFHSGGYPASPAGLSARPCTLRGFVFRRFDRIICVNPKLVELFHRFGLQPEKVRLILPHALPPAPQDRRLSERLEGFFEAHDPVLCTVGLLEPEYDLPLQIDALGLTRERHPKAGLVIIGSGSLEGDLRTRIAGKPYAGDVLLCGDVPHEETLGAIRRCDVFLRTSRYDGDSVAVREALHLAVPVVATDTGLRPQGVRLVPIGDPAALRGAIEERLGLQEEERGPGVENGKNIEEVLALYRDLMSARSIS